MVPGINLVSAGAGSNGLIEAVIIDALRKEVELLRVGGSSAGAINAVGCALKLDNLTGFWRQFLTTTGGLEDYHLPGPLKPLGVLKSAPRCGMMAGNKIRQALVGVAGGKRMSDLHLTTRVVVGNLSKRKTQVVDSQLGLIEIEPEGIRQVDALKRHALVVDALRCSLAVPFVIDAAQLVPEEKDLYTDGGTGANAPSGLWDDHTCPTVVIAFKNSERIQPVKSLKDFALAIFDIRQDSSNAAMASRSRGKVFKIEIESGGDSLDFSLTEKEADRRIAEGIKMVRRLNLKPILESKCTG